MPTSEQDLTVGTGRRFIHPSLLAVPANSDITNDNFSGIGIGYSDDGDDASDEDSGGETSCEIALGECSSARAELEEENGELKEENDDLNNAVDNIIDGNIPADAQGIIVSNSCTLTITDDGTTETDGYNTGQLKYARAGGAGNFIEGKSQATLWSEAYGIDPAGGPNFGVGPPFCALRIVGNGYGRDCPTNRSSGRWHFHHGDIEDRYPSPPRCYLQPFPTLCRVGA